jgi:hypothetical protein
LSSESNALKASHRLMPRFLSACDAKAQAAPVALRETSEADSTAG